MRARSPFLAIVEYTLRTCTPAKRIFAVLPLIGTLIFALIARTFHDRGDLTTFVDIVGTGLYHLIAPITCLIIGDSILGAELRAGTFTFTWLSPVKHRTIVLGRWLGGWIITATMLVPSVVLAAIVAGAPEGIWPGVVAVLAASAAYLTLFIAVGVSFQRPIVWSLVLVILIERLLGTALDGVAQLTPGWLGEGAMIGLSHLPSYRDGVPHGWSAVLRLGILALAGLWLSIFRLKRLRPASASD